MKTLKEISVSDKKVLVRVDCDAPLINGSVAESYRLEAALPTINYLINEKAKIVVLGHLGRPEGKVDEDFSLKPVVEWWRERIANVYFANSCLGLVAEAAVGNLSPSEVLFLENVRFFPGEEANDTDFAKSLARLGDIYVNECFGASHRDHASIVGIPRYIPAFAGERLQVEVSVLTRVCESFQRPLIVIVGGAKPETKVPLVRKIAAKADAVLLGGMMMFDKSLTDLANVIYPIDAVGVNDIGPQTIDFFSSKLQQAATIIWNGPLGVINEPEFSKGTEAVAKTLAGSSAYTIVGGGDTIMALRRLNLCDKMSFVSTGGGAFLQFVADGTLPGLEALGWKKI